MKIGIPSVALFLSVLLLNGYFNLSAADPGDVLTVDEAANRIGEVVTFEGEVVSTPSSPRRAAIYANFGNAYPWQTMSVLFANEHTNIIWNLPRLRGRNVRVTGLVESTKAGPVITVTNADQIVVLGKVTVPVALDENGESHPFRNRIAATIMNLFNDKDFAALENVAQKWQSGRERFLDGHWKIQTFFDSFNDKNIANEVSRTKFFATLDEWKSKYPESVIPFIVKANALATYAWQARGGGYSYTVTGEGWERFGERLDQAKTELDAVYDRRATYPQWYLVMQTIALGQGWPRSDYEKMFEEAVATEPEYHFLYVSKARYLQSKWYGEPGDWEDFAKSLISRFPDGRGETFYTFIVWNMRSEVEREIKKDGGRYFKDTYIEWPLCKAGFERLREKYPDSMWILNNFAFLSGKAGDMESLNELMVELGDNCDMRLWVTWENVALVRLFAAGKAPPGVHMNLFD